MPPIPKDAIVVRAVAYYSMDTLQNFGILWAKPHKMSVEDFRKVRPFVFTKVNDDEVEAHPLTTQEGADRIHVENAVKNEGGDGRWQLGTSHVNDVRNYFRGTREQFAEASKLTDNFTDERRRPFVSGKTLADILRRKGRGNRPAASEPDEST